MSKLYNGKTFVIDPTNDNNIKILRIGNDKKPTKATPMKVTQGRADRKYGGRMKLKGGSFPDLNKDGKVTKADILMGRGVIPKKKNKKMMAKKKSPRKKAMGLA